MRERDIQCPVEHVALQEATIEPFASVRFADVRGHGGEGQRQNAIADQRGQRVEKNSPKQRSYKKY